MRRIYLDYNATTPIAPSVQEAMLPFLSEHYGNPSSSHSLGRAAAEAIEDARGHVASLINADRDEIVFTGCGTESNNLALFGIMAGDAPPFRGDLIISAFEHPSVAEPAKYLEQLGCKVSMATCGSDGVTDVDSIRSAVRAETKLVSVMHANNEIGTIQPIREIVKLCRDRHVLVHTDAAQTAGKIPIDVEKLEVDLLSIAGHKLYAPKGVGALYVRRGVALKPFMRGAGHEGGLRPGTENTAGIVGLGKAASIARKAMAESTVRLAQLRDRFIQRLREEIGSELTINGEKAARLPNTISVNFPHVAGGELLNHVPELMASTGSACHSGTTKPSATLQAIHLDPEIALGTVRLSIGWYTSAEDIDRAASLLVGAWERLR